MGRVVVTTRIAATPARVWRALTLPSEVAAWDGVEPLDVGDDYPAVGRHARWRTRVGPFPLTLHDRITVVEPLARFAAVIDVGFVHVDEEYRLSAVDDGTELVVDDTVSSRVPGLGWLALRLTRANVATSMARLGEHCRLG